MWCVCERETTSVHSRAHRPAAALEPAHTPQGLSVEASEGEPRPVSCVSALALRLHTF